MKGEQKKLNSGRPDRGVRTALMLCVFSFSGVTLLGIARLAFSLRGGLSLLFNVLSTAACFLLPALLGLYWQEDKGQSLPLCGLSAGQRLELTLLGVLAVCPMTLLGDILLALAGRMGLPVEWGTLSPEASLFVPMLIQSALLAPVSEELFFRGYLQRVMDRHTRGYGAVAAALLFALAHGMDWLLFPRFLFGLLLGTLMERTGSLFAPVLVHGCYNLVLLLAVFCGLGGLLSGLTMVSSGLRLLGSWAFLAVLRRAWSARRMQTRIPLTQDGPLSRRQWALIGGTGCALILCVILAEVMG